MHICVGNSLHMYLFQVCLHYLSQYSANCSDTFEILLAYMGMNQFQDYVEFQLLHLEYLELEVYWEANKYDFHDFFL